MQAATAKHLERESAREAARAEAHAAQAARHRGVSYAGLAPEPFRPKAQRDLIAAAEAAAAREAAYDESALGQAMAAAVSIRQRTFLLAQYAQSIEAALSRGDGSAAKAVDLFTALVTDIKSDTGLLWVAAHDADMALEAA